MVSHLVDSVEEVPDHVELVVDDTDLGTVRQKARQVRLPRIYDPMSNLMGPILPEPCPERLQGLLFVPLDGIQELRAPETSQGADQGPVGLPLPNPDLVKLQDGDPVQRPLRLDLFHHRLVDLPDRSSVKPQKSSASLASHDLAQLVEQVPQRLRDMRPPNIYKVQGLRPDSAIRTLDPITPEAHDGQGLQPQQMSDFLLMAVVSWKTCFPARAASMGFFQTLDGDKDPPKSALVFDPNSGDLKSWKIQKRRDKPVRHPMSPPYCHLALNHTELSYPHRGLFYPHYLVKSLFLCSLWEAVCEIESYGITPRLKKFSGMARITNMINLQKPGR